MNAAPKSVVVVGGGVIGLACAHYLEKADCAVTVVDRGEIGQGCSHANCGLIVPSHVLPLAEPGAIGDALRSLLKPNSPFRVKPRLDLDLFGWLWNFARRCNRRDMLRSGRAIQPLLESSRKLYDSLMATEPLYCEWQANGVLFVFRDPDAMEAYAEADRLMSDAFHVKAERLDGPAVLAKEPALKPGVSGGWFYDDDAHLRPDRLMASWHSLLQTRGVVFHEKREMRGLARRGARAVAVKTNDGELQADAVVIAAGAWSPLLSHLIDCRIPIQPGKGYSITMPRPLRCPAIPLLFPEHRVVVTPMESGYRLGSIMEFAGYDDSLPENRLQLLRNGAEPYLHEPTCEPIEEKWFGWRPMTYDSVPIIDRAPRLENVFVATGHNMLGLSMAPATGKLIAELVCGMPAHLRVRPYSLRRFS